MKAILIKKTHSLETVVRRKASQNAQHSEPYSSKKHLPLLEHLPLSYWVPSTLFMRLLFLICVCVWSPTCALNNNI